MDEVRWSALLRERYSVVHVHWPERMIDGSSVVRRLGMVGALAAARQRGSLIVWTIHNLGSHESQQSWSRAWSWRTFTRLVDGVLAMTPGGLSAARAKFPGLRHAPAFVVPHGHYRDLYPAPVPRADAREALELTEATNVMLNLGMFRRYKGVSRLLRVFEEWPDDRSVLIIAGAPHDRSLARQLREAARRDPRVRLLDHFVDDLTMTRLFAAADVVVLPYLDILNSGVAMLALSLQRPVIGPSKGAFPELQAQVGTTWVRTFDEPFDLDALTLACREPTLPPDDLVCDLSAFEWSAIAKQTIGAYCDLLATKTRRLSQR